MEDLQKIVDFGYFVFCQTDKEACLSNLLTKLEDITSSLDDGAPVDVIFLDYKKAFDSVPHRRLFEKLEAYGYAEKVLKWVGSILQGRTHLKCFSPRSFVTQVADVVSGVPQGSVLGPMIILFVIYINDLPDIVKRTVQRVC